ncbi:MAG: ATP-grasp domain-containing protein [Clostridiaceae bacterium]|nr:ATP-grasp domain-containing protein [Clostridiaceae bacterium]
MNKKTAIVLGGTSPHIALIQKLKDRGYFTILIDYLDNPPAKQAADLHIQESTLDNDAVYRVAKEYDADLVMSACVDQANITACYVAEKLGLPHPYSFELASNITNKGYMKRVMFDNDIPTSKYIYLEPDQELPDIDLHYPVMVKPADSCAASGIKKAVGEAEMLRFYSEAKKISRNGRVVIEEFVKGDEVSVYSFVSHGKAEIIMISQRMSVIEGQDQVIKCYATLAPAPISKIVFEKIQSCCTKIANAFGLDNTPLHVQVMIDKDEIEIIEIAPRAGGGVSYQTIKSNTGFDILEATIDSYLQVPVKVHYGEPKYYYAVNILYGIPCVFGHVDGEDELMANDIIESFHYHKTKGMKITSDRASGGRIAAAVVKGKTKEELLSKIKFMMKKIEAYDDKGNPVLRKDLYLRDFRDLSN